MIMNECDVSMNSNMIVTMMMINEMSRVHTKTDTSEYTKQ